MQLSLSLEDLASYVAAQLNNFFPDGREVAARDIRKAVGVTVERVDYCFKHSSSGRYAANGTTIFNHLYSDHYVVFLWMLSSTIWRETGPDQITDKLYCLNKMLHGLNCMYDAGLPDIFLLFHTVGTVLGKAEYSDYFVALHGCTVGSHNEKYPVLGKGVAMAANSALIGNCKIGDRVSIGAHTTVFQKDIPSDSSVYINEGGQQVVRLAEKSYAQSFFNVKI